MEKVQIKKIYFNQSNKDGQPYLDKSQRPYTLIGIYDQNGRKLYGRAYQGSPLLSLREGAEIEVEVSEYATGKYSFRFPNKEDKILADIKDLQERVGNLEMALMNPSDEDTQPEEKEEELPF